MGMLVVPQAGTPAWGTTNIPILANRAAVSMRYNLHMA